MPRIGRQACMRGEQWRQRVDDWHHQLVLRAGAVRLCHHDDLRVIINGRYAGIALDHPCAGRHLGTLVIRPIALPPAAGGAARLVRMGDEPRTQRDERDVLRASARWPDC